MEEYYTGEYDDGDQGGHGDYGGYHQGGQSGYNRPPVVIQHPTEQPVEERYPQWQSQRATAGAEKQVQQQDTYQQPRQDVLTLHPGWNGQRKPVPSPSHAPSSEDNAIQEQPQQRESGDESFAERMKRTFKGLPRDVSSAITSIESGRSNAGSPYDMDDEYPGEILPFPPPPPRHRDRDIEGDGMSEAGWSGSGERASGRTGGMWKAAEEMFSGVKRQC
ncbi:hypothetical protein B0T21DRAFT_360990 [Apiosordaria backusii]|uniref:Uncharacterized protein n=1 Tax=Apiosordaria backusii TaxID=314023 RepID=A0AA40EMW9_9PEZI|nr:hypothetical protein B0T21DRAFT_360990 [Apiosordaria backusii]